MGPDLASDRELEHDGASRLQAIADNLDLCAVGRQVE
jgi:hypothetical protein